MEQRLRVLMIEDSEDDVELLMRELRRGGYAPEWLRVDNAEDMQAALREHSWDVALCDNLMPRFSAPEALQILQASGLDIPFIIVSGTISEDLAVAAMKAGAHDYIQKSQLRRLIPAIQRELREAGVRREQQYAEAALKAAEYRFRVLVEHSLVGVYIIQDRRFVYVNPKMAEIFGYDRGDMLQLDSVLELVAPKDRERVRRNIDEHLAAGRDSLHYAFCGRKQPNADVEVEVYGTRADIGGQVVLIGTLLDVTERKRAQARIQYLADYDDLTGLPNRHLFTERLTQRLHEAARGHMRCAVLTLNIDRLKTVNDSLGRNAGDTAIRETASRLLHAKGPMDELARIGGNDFALILSPLERAEDAAHQAERLLEPFKEPFRVLGQEQFLTASMGISLYPEDAADAELLLDAADAATQRAKDLGGAGYRFFTREMTERTRRRIAVENGLRRSLHEHGFELHYQPKVSLATGKVAGVEALIRWRRADGRLTPPGEFIGVAEETGLIWPLGEWVLRAACAQAKAWFEEGIELPIAVNVSGRQFGQEGMLDLVTDILARERLRPDLLELELTESVLMQNLDKTVPILDSLNSFGVRLSIDDFGTGYSSLAYLKRFPIDTLKIDQSFVSDVPGDADDSAIARAVVQMGHSLGVKVVAEGVESQAQLDFLKREGCDEVQGFLLGVPLPADRLRLSLNTMQARSPYLN